MPDAPSGPPSPRGGGRCPICQRPSDPVLKPFCSKRCADVDLHRWLAGSYRIPVDDEPDEFEDGADARKPTDTP